MACTPLLAWFSLGLYLLPPGGTVGRTLDSFSLLRVHKRPRVEDTQAAPSALVSMKMPPQGSPGLAKRAGECRSDALWDAPCRQDLVAVATSVLLFAVNNVPAFAVLVADDRSITASRG